MAYTFPENTITTKGNSPLKGCSKQLEPFMCGEVLSATFSLKSDITAIYCDQCYAKHKEENNQ